jgi:hypothetical protein
MVGTGAGLANRSEARIEEAVAGPPGDSAVGWDEGRLRVDARPTGPGSDFAARLPVTDGREAVSAIVPMAPPSPLLCNSGESAHRRLGMFADRLVHNQLKLSRLIPWNPTIFVCSRRLQIVTNGYCKFPYVGSIPARTSIWIVPPTE